MESKIKKNSLTTLQFQTKLLEKLLRISLDKVLLLMLVLIGRILEYEIGEGGGKTQISLFTFENVYYPLSTVVVNLIL